MPEGDERTAGAPRSRRERFGRASARPAELAGRKDAFVAYLKERVYATFTGLAIILAVDLGDHPEADHALVALLLGVLGITVAGFVSDILSHLAVHRTFPDGTEFAIRLRVAAGSISTMVTPGILLALALFGVLEIDTALRICLIVYIATLGVIGWLAVRRSRLTWWQQLSALAMLIALGLVVVGLQTLAHSY